MFQYTLNLIVFCISCLSVSAKKDLPVTIHHYGHKDVKFTTIQNAIDQAIAGDTILIKEGVYYESLTIKDRFNKSENPIVIKAYPGQKVVIDGASQAFTKPNTLWRKTEQDIYEADVPWHGDSLTSIYSWVSKTDEQLIATYHDLNYFHQAPRGEGIYRNKQSVLLRLNSNPNTTCLNIPEYESNIRIENAAGWVIQNLQLQHAAIANVYFVGTASHHITLDSIDCKTAWNGIRSDSDEKDGNIQYIRIRNCHVKNKWNSSWKWINAYRDAVGPADGIEQLGVMRGTGIKINADNSEVFGNTVEGNFDGMALRGKNLKGYNNTLFDIYDDGVELESDQSENVEFFDNLIYNAFCGISIVSNTPGPVYIYRNRVSANKKVDFTGEVGERYGCAIKCGTNWGPGAKNMFIYHNTLFGKRIVVWNKATTPFINFQFYNNIFYGMGNSPTVDKEASGEINTSTDLYSNGNRWDGNLYFRTGSSSPLFSKWDGGKACYDLESCRAQFDGFEEHGKVADPLFSSLDTGDRAFNDFLISAKSPAIDAGVTIPEAWPMSNDSKDGKPDIGASEYGLNK